VSQVRALQGRAAFYASPYWLVSAIQGAFEQRLSIERPDVARPRGGCLKLCDRALGSSGLTDGDKTIRIPAFGGGLRIVWKECRAGSTKVKRRAFDDCAYRGPFEWPRRSELRAGRCLEPWLLDQL
jgi:hypothetical protein